MKMDLRLARWIYWFNSDKTFAKQKGNWQATNLLESISYWKW